MSALTDIPQVTTAVAIYDASGRWLLQEFRGVRYPGMFGFAGGKVDPGESPLEAAKRELYEEAGIHAYDWEPGLWSYDRYPDTEEHFVCVYWMAKSAMMPCRMEPTKTLSWQYLPPEQILTDKLLPGCVDFFTQKGILTS